MPTPTEYRSFLANQEADVSAGVVEAKMTIEFLQEFIRDKIGQDGSLSLADLSSLRREYAEGINRLKSKEPSLQDLSKLSYLEIIKEMKRLRVDPVDIGYGKRGLDTRENKLAGEFFSRFDECKSATLTPEQRLDLLAERVEFLLEKLWKKKDAGKGHACIPFHGSGGFELFNDLNAYQVSREDLLQATTYHPVWGEQTRNLLHELVVRASTQSMTLSNGVKFGYSALTDSKGMDYLTEAIDLIDPTAHPKAKTFAWQLFKIFPFLDLVLMEGQRHSNGTKGHNPDDNGVDPIAMFDPIASLHQNWDRYGGNEADWRAWFLTLVQTIPDGDYGPANDATSTNDASLTRELQEKLLRYYDMFFPVSYINRQPTLSVGETYFPSPFDLVTLGELDRSDPAKREEVLDRLGKDKITRSGATTRTPDPVKSWDLYRVAMKGWEQLLKLTYSATGSNLTEDQIFAEYKADKRGGLLNAFFSEAGAAKVFCPRHLRLFLEPMLTQFCYRLLQNSAGDEKVKRRIRDKMIEEINKTKESSRGLAAFPDELDRVIANLNHPESYQIGVFKRGHQKDLAIQDWANDHLGSLKPTTSRLMPVKIPGINYNAEQTLYFEFLRGNKIPPPPARREGSMIPPAKSS